MDFRTQLSFLINRYKNKLLHKVYMADFRKRNFDERLKESIRIRAKYPDRIPVIVDNNAHSTLPELDKKKFLVPGDLTVGQFVYIVRKRIKLPPEKAIFIFVNNILPPTSSLMSTMYDSYKDSDGFLYLYIAGENTFG